MTLPPGPRRPVTAQTFEWIVRPMPFMERCMRRYGDFFTIRLSRAGNIVFLADPDAIKEVFTGDPNVLHAGENNSLLEPLMGQHSVLLLDGPEHLRQRRLMLPSFHGERMHSYGRLIEQVAEREIDTWPVGEQFPLRPRMQAITLEVIMRAVFGIEDAERLATLRNLLRSLLEIGSGGWRWVGIIFPALQRSFGPRSPWVRFQTALEQVDALLFDEIRRRRSDPSTPERDDILSMLLQARDEDGNPMTDQELRDELMTLLVAGHETTATALSWSFELLLHNPAALARLEAEMSQDSDGDGEYLDAVIRETLRLRPVVVLVGRILKEPMKLKGYMLPAGTRLSPCIYLTHRLPEIYPEPERFRPERFLEQTADTYSWIPFGGGIRRCLGGTFAIFEMKVVIPAVLKRARLRAVGGPEPMRRRAITFVPARDAMVIADRVEAAGVAAPEKAPVAA